MAVTALDPEVVPTEWKVNQSEDGSTYVLEWNYWRYYGSTPFMYHVSETVDVTAVEADIETTLNGMIADANALTAPPA